MQRSFIKITLSFLAFLMLVVSFYACSTKTGPGGANAPLVFDQVMENEQNPKRLASLQKVSTGRKEVQNLRYERAAQEYSKALEIDPQNPFAYFYFAEVRAKVQRFDEALDLYDQAANFFVTQPQWKAQALTQKGEILENLKDYTRAKQAYDSALQIFPKSERARQGNMRLSKD